MDKMIHGIESAQQDVQVGKALQQANQLMKDIKADPNYMDIDKVEELYDDIKDQQA